MTKLNEVEGDSDYDVAFPEDQQRFAIDTQARARTRRQQFRMWSVPAGISVYLILGWIIALFFDSSRDFAQQWWWAFALPVGGLLALSVVLYILQSSEAGKQARGGIRAGIVVWVVLPLSITGMILIGLVVPPDYQLTVIRGVFLAVVCLLPGTLWWLFTSQRKHGLLYEWIGHLSHLGLLEAEEYETKLDRDRRVSAYFKRFGAVYGPVSPERKVRVLYPPSIDSSLVDQGRNLPTDGESSTFTYNTSIPVIVATVLITLGWLIVLPPVVGSELVQDSGFLETWLRALQPQRDAVAFAFLGAYFYSIQLLFRRYVLTDLQPAAYVAVTVRILMAVIGTWAVVTAFGDSFDQQRAMIFGFIVGVFPTTALQLIEILVKRLISFVFRVPSLQPSFPLAHIEGLTVWHRSRLEEEDIENVPSLATADIPDLLLRTRYSVDRVIDWVDQALLLTAMGEPSKDDANTSSSAQSDGGQPSLHSTLRGCTIRSATSFLAAHRAQLLTDKSVSDCMGLPNARVELVAATLHTLPNLRLVENWQNVTPMPTEMRRRPIAV